MIAFTCKDARTAAKVEFTMRLYALSSKTPRILVHDCTQLALIAHAAAHIRVWTARDRHMKDEAHFAVSQLASEKAPDYQSGHDSVGKLRVTATRAAPL